MALTFWRVGRHCSPNFSSSSFFAGTIMEEQRGGAGDEQTGAAEGRQNVYS